MKKGMHKYDFDRSAFANIDSKEKAYWHGFISADGYVNIGTHSLGVSLSVKDDVLIDRFISFLKAPLRIKRYYLKRKDKYHNKNREYKYCSMCVYSEQLVNDFLKYVDIQGNQKSKRLTLPDFENEQLNLAWLMGYYDGDGSEACPRLSSSSKKLLEQIRNKYNIDFEIKIHRNVYVLYLGEYFREKLCQNYKYSLLRKRIVLKQRKERGRNKDLMCLTDQILRHLVKTHSLSEIGNMFGVSRISVFAKSRRLGIQVPKRKGGRKSLGASRVKISCAYYPCHNVEGFERCDFCYCPLFTYDNCGGKYKILENGIKDCSDCNIPHSKEGYDYIVGFLKKNIRRFKNGIQI